MKKIFFFALLSIISFSSMAANRLKDVVTVKGVRENPLIGYGLVIGLNGTGDSGGEITNTSLKKMFQTLGLNPQKEVSSKNVAAVIVTGKLPAFGRVGQKVDVSISSIGDASSLAGGTLLVTPLKGGDGLVYAVASGQVSIGGSHSGKKFTTSGLIANGATIEKELDLQFNNKQSLRLALNHPDFTTAARIEKTINEELGGKFAQASDSATIDLIIPQNYLKKVVELIAVIENIKVNEDSAAKIVINERTGTIVAGGEITLNQVAISHGDLVIEVSKSSSKSSKAGSLNLIEKKTTLKELVEALNALGTSPDDLISIFQALKRNGALIADIEFI